jgi:hypothetical protein
MKHPALSQRDLAAHPTLRLTGRPVARRPAKRRS